jgi:hypothetical protein
VERLELLGSCHGRPTLAHAATLVMPLGMSRTPVGDSFTDAREKSA